MPTEYESRGSDFEFQSELEQERGRARSAGFAPRGAPARAPRAHPGRQRSARGRRRPWVFDRPLVSAPLWPMLQALPPAEPAVEPADDGPPAPADSDPPPAQDAAAGPVEDGQPEGAGELVPWLESALSRELEITRMLPSITIEWQPPASSGKGSAFRAPDGGGIYIVLRKGQPLYVGATKSFKQRWAARLLVLFQLGVTSSRAVLPEAYTVHFGKLEGANREALLRGAEHAVIRALLRPGRVKLRNTQSTTELRATKPATVTNVLPPVLRHFADGTPGFSGGTLHLRPDLPLELGGWGP